MALSGLKIQLNLDTGEGYFFWKITHPSQWFIISTWKNENWKIWNNQLQSTSIIKKYVIHITNLKQALKHGLILKKVHWVIKFIQKAWLKSNIDVKKSKKWFWKKFSQTDEQCSVC